MPKGFRCSVQSSTVNADAVYTVIPSSTIMIGKAIKDKMRTRFNIEDREFNVDYCEVDLNSMPISRLTAMDMIDMLRN